MNLLFERSFLKDLEKLKSQDIKTQVIDTINFLEQVKSFESIQNLKKKRKVIKLHLESD